MFLICSVLLGLTAMQDVPVEEETYAFMYFYTPDCPACDQIEPFIDYLREEYAIRIYSYNLRNPVGLQYGMQHEIRYVPTLIIQIDKGEEREFKRYENIDQIRKAEPFIADISQKTEPDNQD
jgi:thiol-disulfide isomerase/thioredoxin